MEPETDENDHASAIAGATGLSEAALNALRGLGLLRDDGSVLGREERPAAPSENHDRGECNQHAFLNDFSAGPIATSVASSKTPESVVKAKTNADFKRHDYWEKRFTQEEEYDWLVRFETLKSELVTLLSPNDKILIVGCGNSTFSSDLYDAGFENIVNIDFSNAVIKSMSDRHGTLRPNMTWLEMDMLDLQFPDASFDVVLDKAAMDALMVDEGDVWDPSRDCVLAAHRMCRGIDRVLRPGGVHIQISFAQPHFRTKYLMGERFVDLTSASGSSCSKSPYSASEGACALYHWTLAYRIIQPDGGCLNSFMYIMRKDL
jgi:hypothetical protein